MDNTQTLTFRGKSGGELSLVVYPRPLLFDLRLGELLGEPPPDASPATKLLHWNRLGVIFAGEGIRPGRTDLPPLPCLNAGTLSEWWDYADKVASVFTALGLTESAVLRVRTVSDKLTLGSEELDEVGND
jgi:hypothetical protein